MISRGDASAASPAGVAAGSVAAPLSAVGARVPVSQPTKPSGLVLQKRPREYAAVDQPTSAAKKKKEAPATSETQLPTAVVPPPARKDGTGSRASAAGSSLRDSKARPQEKALAPTPPLPIVPLGRDPPASPDDLEDALSALTQLRVDLHVADRWLASGRLELVSGWLRSDASVRAAWRHVVVASKEGKQAADLAAAVRWEALKDAEAAKERCRAAEAELETLRNERAAESAREEAAERSRLGELKKEVEEGKARLEAKVKILAKDHAAFDSLEKRSRKALQELYGRGLKEPLVSAEEGPAELLPQLVEALEGVANGVGTMVEGEARALSSSAMTRIFSHLHLRDPSTDLGALLEPVDEGRCAAAAEVVKDLGGHAEEVPRHRPRASS
nr:uncharacterized protein LOC109783714 [Aegilops tauschii subsp. strangulata]